MKDLNILIEEYNNAHIDRLIEATNNLYKQPNSICMKCHNVETINCIYCYCPLYTLENCGGNFILLSGDIKDCSNCIKPHTKDFVKSYLKQGINNENFRR